MEHAVWYKNRSPTRALKNKTTPWEALYSYKPDLTREHIFGSRMFVTLPPEKGRDILPKIHAERGWMGYYVGCESKSIYKIFSEKKHRVFRIGVAQVQDGDGLDDQHDQPSLSDRIPTQPMTGKETSLGDSDEEEMETDECLSESSEECKEEDLEENPPVEKNMDDIYDEDFWHNADDEDDEDDVYESDDTDGNGNGDTDNASDADDQDDTENLMQGEPETSRNCQTFLPK